MPIIALIVIGFISLVSFIFARKTLGFLRTEIEPYYAFDLKLKSGGFWSVVFFIVIILLLTAVFLILSRANISLSPA